MHEEEPEYDKLEVISAALWLARLSTFPEPYYNFLANEYKIHVSFSHISYHPFTIVALQRAITHARVMQQRFVIRLRFKQLSPGLRRGPIERHRHAHAYPNAFFGLYTMYALTSPKKQSCPRSTPACFFSLVITHVILMSHAFLPSADRGHWFTESLDIKKPLISKDTARNTFMLHAILDACNKFIYISEVFN